LIQDETPPQDESTDHSPQSPEDESPDPSPQTPEAEGPGEEEAPPAEEEAPAAAEEQAPTAEGEPPAAEGEAPAAEGEAPEAEPPKPGKRDKKDDKPAEEVIPGAHLEPDLVLEEEQAPETPEDIYATEDEPAEEREEPETEPAPVAATPLDLAADARYRATGKRKSAVARVILKPGDGTYSVNGRQLDQFFPRNTLQRMARQPLEATGNTSRMDVVARIHGGGVASQAGALRHGIARALVEADPNLRTELKRRGYLTRDPRVKERKKAGLKKARKRPQFSKR
jgi:small subunit ribosomal protein S9